MYLTLAARLAAARVERRRNGLGERAAVPDCSTEDQDLRAGWVRLPQWANSVRLSTVRAAPGQERLAYSILTANHH